MIYNINNPKKINFYWSLEEDNFTGVVKDRDGNIAYYKNDSIHREDGPAVIHAYGSKEWRIHGKRHREDGPAVEYANGTKEWWYNARCYGYDDNFTVESWIKKWKLEIFK